MKHGAVAQRPWEEKRPCCKKHYDCPFHAIRRRELPGNQKAEDKRYQEEQTHTPHESCRADQEAP